MITGPIRQDGPIDHIDENWNTYHGRRNNYNWYSHKHTTLGRLKNIYVWTLIFVSLSLGGLGFIDDTLKIKHKNSSGLKSRYKFAGQLIIGALTLFILIKFSNHEYLYELYFPFSKNLIWQMGLFLFRSDFLLLSGHLMQ